MLNNKEKRQTMGTDSDIIHAEINSKELKETMLKMLKKIQKVDTIDEKKTRDMG